MYKNDQSSTLTLPLLPSWRRIPNRYERWERSPSGSWKRKAKRRSSCNRELLVKSKNYFKDSHAEYNSKSYVLNTGSYCCNNQHQGKTDHHTILVLIVTNLVDFFYLQRNYPLQKSKWGIQQESESFVGEILQTSGIQCSYKSNEKMYSLKLIPSENNLNFCCAHFSSIVKENFPILDFIF